MEEIKTHFLRGVAAINPDTLSEVSRAFASLPSAPQATFGRNELLAAMSDRASLNAFASIPTIDTRAAARIAGLWGREGVQRQLEALGIDWTFDDTDDESRPARDTDRPKGPHTDQNLRFLDVFNIVLVILVFLYQVEDARQMEVRIAGEIRAHNSATDQRLHALEQLLINALATLTPSDDAPVKFVVRARVAFIRRDARHGSTPVATVFPNQVVTLLEERSKWIKVEYFDWITQETRTGWALKKHFVRVQSRAGGPG